VLLEDIKYFFYIHESHCIPRGTDRGAGQWALRPGKRDRTAENGVNAMRMPVDDLLSNWAYMVMSALAWNLKAWYGLLMPNRERGLELLRMEFRRFLHLIVMLPARSCVAVGGLFTGPWVTTIGSKTFSLLGVFAPDGACLK